MAAAGGDGGAARLPPDFGYDTVGALTLTRRLGAAPATHSVVKLIRPRPFARAHESYCGACGGRGRGAAGQQGGLGVPATMPLLTEPGEGHFPLLKSVARHRRTRKVLGACFVFFLAQIH